MTIETTTNEIIGTIDVEGYLIDRNGNTINGKTLLVYLLTGMPVVPGAVPYQLTDGSYSAWTSVPIDKVGVLFTAPGFKDKLVPFQELLLAPDVIMTESGEIPIWAILAVMAAVAAFRKKSKKVGALNNSDVFTVFLIIGGVIGLSIVIKILRGLGIFGGQNVGDEQSDPNSPWKPSYWQKFTTFTYALTETQAKAYGSTIYNAFTLFQDDWNAIQGVFSQMRTKANVSFLAWEFQKQYDEDLLSFLTNGGGILPWDGLSTAHMDTLINLVKNLPNN